jgi:hypothetical protein
MGVVQCTGAYHKERAEQQVDAAHAEVDALKGTAYVPKSRDTTVQDLLGISDDLSAEALLLRVGAPPVRVVTRNWRLDMRRLALLSYSSFSSMLYITATIAVGQRCAGSDAITLTARQDHCASSQVKPKDQALTVKKAHILIEGFKGLLRLQAIERGEGDGSHWHASKESLIQARADERTIQELLAEIYAKQQVPCKHHPACLLQHGLRVPVNVAPTSMCCNCLVSRDLQHVFCHAWLTCCASTVCA